MSTPFLLQCTILSSVLMCIKPEFPSFYGCDNKTIYGVERSNFTSKLCAESSPFRKCSTDACGLTVQKPVFGSLINVGPLVRSCSCDSLCVRYGDCCPDFWVNCSDHANVTVVLPTECFEASKPTSSNTYHTLMVNNCPNDFKNEQMTRACLNTDETLLNRIPVRDNVTGIHYRNIFCAQCHGVLNMQFWKFDLTCYENSEVSAQNNLKGFLQRLNDPLCNLTTEDRDGKYRYCHPEVVRDCPRDCKSKELVKQCQSSQTVFGSPTGGYYKNYYCAICTDPQNIAALTCRSQSNGPVVGRPQPEPKLWKFSFSLLLDVNKIGKLHLDLSEFLGSKTKSRAASKALCDSINLTKCRFSKCQEDYFLQNGECVPRYTLSFVRINIQYIPYEIDNNNNNNNNALFTTTFNEIDKQTFSSQIMLFIMEEGLEKSFYINSKPNFTRNVEKHHFGSNYSVDRIHLDITFMQRINNAGCVMQGKGKSARYETFKSRMRWLFSTRLGHVVAISVNASGCFQQNTNSSECTNSTLYTGDFNVLSNGDVFLKGFGGSVPKADVYKVNETLVVCLDNIQPYTQKTSALGILTIVCFSLSEVFLLIRVILQPFCSVYHTFPGKLQFCLTLQLFLAGLFFLLRSVAGVRPWLCETFAALTQWAYLSVFAWKNVIAVDTWSAFHLTIGHAPQKNHRRLFLSWCYAILVPAAITTVSVIFDFSDVETSFQPNFVHGELCWFTQTNAFLIFFVAPVAVFVLSNIIIYSLIAHSLHKSLKLSKTVTNSKKNSTRNEFIIYLKLFVLLGLTWIFGFVAMAANNEVVWYIFTVLSASQGVFVFVAFVCTRRVLNALGFGKITRLSKQTVSSNLTSKSTKASRNGQHCSTRL